MALAKHVDADSIIQKLHSGDDKAHKHHKHVQNASYSLTPYSSRYNAQDEISKYRIPQNGAPVSSISATGGNANHSRPMLFTKCSKMSSISTEDPISI